jgi:hypothetical protein
MMILPFSTLYYHRLIFSTFSLTLFITPLFSPFAAAISAFAGADDYDIDAY